jgi:hypothetical protein
MNENRRIIFPRFAVDDRDIILTNIYAVVIYSKVWRDPNSIFKKLRHLIDSTVLLLRRP